MPKNRLKGTYCLIIQLKSQQNIKIGRLGEIDFKRGYYVYVGSALNSLKSRLERHLKDDKKLFWHVDYLLNNPDANVEDVVFAVSDEKWECPLAAHISEEGSEIHAFGCSDCKCPSHLFYFQDLEGSKRVCLESFEKLGLKTLDLDDLEKL